MSEEQKRYILNKFSGGQINDPDVSVRQNNNFAGATNIRLFQDEKGLVITNIKGNKYSEADKVGFKISEGYIPLGGCELNGILYVVSAKEEFVNSDEVAHGGEIGCFPSWTSHDGLGELENVYRPLQNFYDETDTLGDFRTDEFLFSLDHPVEAFAWNLVDGSTNIYFTDFNKPIRVVNNGFRYDGESNDVTYKDSYFPNAVSLILSGNKTLLIDDFTVETGGKLKGGNYFFFLRYANYQLNPTHFLAESKPIQMIYGQSTVQHTEGTFDESGKKVTFTLSNLDFAYKYVQIAYVRYTSDEVGDEVFETGLVNMDYPIPDEDPLVDQTMDITIVGTEGDRVITIEQILQNRLEDDVCRSIAPIDNRMFGACWKSANVHHSSMVDFAKLITITFNDDTKFYGHNYSLSDPIDAGVRDNWDSNLYDSNCGYKDHYRTANEVGYFRGETYPFGVQFELNTGHLSAAYPIQAQDDWQGTLSPAVKSNYDGIYRFPSTVVSPLTTEDVAKAQKIHILKPEFNLIEAVAAAMVDGSVDGLGWIRRNVRAIRIVRGERYRTLEFQGLAMNCSSPRTITTEDWEMTRDCSLYPTASFTDGSHVTPEIAYLQFDTSTGTWEQFWGFFTDKDEVLGYSGFNESRFWGSEGKTPTLITRTNIDENVHRDAFIPLYRGYAPMVYKDKDKDRDPDSDVKKVNVKNYCSRWFMDQHKLSVFSPDFMFNSLLDISKISSIHSIAKTIPQSYVKGTTEGKWYHDNLIPESGNIPWSDIYPRWTYAECLGVMDEGDEVLNSSVDFTKHAVGDEVDHLPQNANNSFVNVTKDFWQSDVEAMYFATDNKENYIWSNRSIATPKYIGLHLNELPASGNFNLDLVNLYNIPDPSVFDISNAFNTSYTRYSLIGDVINLDWDNIDLEGADAVLENHIIGGGDCFLQRTYFKINGWSGTSLYDVGWENLNPETEIETDFPKKLVRGNEVERVKFTHGVVVGVVTENVMNTAMRSDYKGQSYFPKIGFRDLAQRAYSEDRKESFSLNKGYNRMFSPRQVLGYDPKFVIEDKIRRNRHRFSDENDSTSLIDGFRSFKEYSMRDFTTADGQIMKIAEVNGFLISVCEKAINLHYVNERQVHVDPNSPDLVLGRGDILSSKIKKLTDYGTQHQLSVVKGKNLYGIDFIRRKAWVIKSASAGGYSTTAGADLSGELMMSNYFKELFTEWEAFSTREYVFSEGPFQKEGILGVYDPKNEEVLFVFVQRREEDLSDFTVWNPTEP